MDEKTVLKKNKNIVTRVIDKEVILMPIYKTSKDINCIYTLDKCGSRVWELIDGKKSLAGIKGQVLKEFESTPEEVDKELNTFLKDLKEIKAVD